MFPVEIWGTVGQWVSGLTSSGALVVGASVLGVDLHRKRRAQATSVIASLKPEGKAVIIGIHNLSDQPIFQYGFVVSNKPTAELKKIAASNAKRKVPEDIPADLSTLENDWHALFLAHWPDADYVLGPKQEKTHHDALSHSRRVYNFYIFFTDAYGRRWVKDARTNKIFGRRGTKRLHPGRSALKTAFDLED